MIPEALTNIGDLNIEDETNILHLNDVYVGPECENFLTTLPAECAQEIKVNCLKFY